MEGGDYQFAATPGNCANTVADVKTNGLFNVTAGPTLLQPHFLLLLFMIPPELYWNHSVLSICHPDHMSNFVLTITPELLSHF